MTSTLPLAVLLGNRQGIPPSLSHSMQGCATWISREVRLTVPTFCQFQSICLMFSRLGTEICEKKKGNRKCREKQILVVASLLEELGKLRCFAPRNYRQLLFSKFLVCLSSRFCFSQLHWSEGRDPSSSVNFGHFVFFWGDEKIPMSMEMTNITMLN